MRKLALVLSFVLLLPIAAMSEDHVISIASLEWPPYAGKELADNGVAVKKLKDIFTDIGYTTRFDSLPWARAKLEVSTGEKRVLFPAWPEEIDEGMIKSDNVMWSEIGLIKKAERTDIVFTTLDEVLNKYTVGIVRDYGYPADLRDKINKAGKLRGQPNDDTQLAKMLNIGRFDISITDPNVAAYYAGQHKLAPIETLHTVTKKALVLGMKDTPENRELMKIINEAIAKKGE